MCLHIGYKKPFIAKSDIEVYKYVNKYYGKYRTACRDYPVHTNEVMKAETNTDIVLDFCNKYRIEGGVIYACTSTFSNLFGCDTCLKAVIRKGTEFYIQDDLKEIAAKELYITDEEITDYRSTDLTEYLEDAIKYAESNKDDIKIGYYLLSNGNFVHPFKYQEGTIIGVVAFFNKDGQPVSISIKSKKLPWLKITFQHEVSFNISYNETIEDMDGIRHTKNILNSKDYDSYNFAAVEYCNKYYTEGTKPGDWYMPAIGECVKIAQNMLIINMALSASGFNTFALFSALWSSSELSGLSKSYVWRCLMYDGHCCNLHGATEDLLFVCPCIVST